MDFWNFWLPLLLCMGTAGLIFLDQHMKSRARAMAKKRHEQERILLKLTTLPPFASTLWGLSCDAFSSPAFLETLREMMKEDLIVDDGHRLYHLTDKGRQVAEDLLKRNGTSP